MTALQILPSALSILNTSWRNNSCASAVLAVGAMSESVGIGKTTVGGDHMQVRVEPLKITEGVNGYGRTGYADTALTEICLKHLPGTATQFDQQFSVE
jgi:hypothetical protein